jgi:outer membrane protein OmpA-like peptidoglycan-associated protein
MYSSKGTLESGFASPIALQGVNGQYHDGPATFNSKGDTMYFTRNNYTKKKVQKSTEDVVDLKIMRAVKKDSTWTDLTEFEYNSKDYSTGHPALNADGSKMYFVSDMPGGLGGTDIYVVERMNNTWSKPVNLGPNINTPYNEMFPMIWKDSILYFSSEGHYNMGGLDVFSSRKEQNSWTEARNMGYPLNTSYDDFGVAMNDSGTAGILSSNRNAKNTMQDNLYTFAINDLRFTLEGIAVDKTTQEPVAGVIVELMNTITNKKEVVTTGPDGKFFFKLNPETSYTVVGTKDGYFTNTEPVTTVGKLRSESMYVKLKLELDRIIVDKPIVLKNIYYDLDKWDIRPDAAVELDNLVQILHENPTISIELGSHTDSRADDKYNMTLSQKRADAAVNYIVSKGISQARITAKGYGETQLVNKCANKVACSEEEHQANRRTEFKVISIAK